MLPLSLPASVTCLLECFRGCFTTPTFTTFCGLACGFWAQPGQHTVTGMLCGARLEQVWHHARAHRFFSQARWSADQLGVCLLDLILAVLVGADAPVRLVCDDTLMRRAGRKVFEAQWHHDPLAPGRHRVAWANNWVVLGMLVDLPFCARPVCLPILARLWRPRQGPGRLDLAVELVKLVCGHLGPRRVDLVCDGAYAGKQLRKLPRQVTVTLRLRADARLHRLPPPPRPGTRGRPRTNGDRLPELIVLAGMVTTPFGLHQVTRYGHGGIAAIAGFACLWPTVFGTRPSRWCWSDPLTRPTASTWRWSPPTLPPPRPSSWNAMPPGGKSRSASARCAKTPASARPATGSAAQWSAPCRSGWSATAWQSSGTPPAATIPPTWPPAARWRPGTSPRPPPRWPTCSPSCAGCSSPRSIARVRPLSRPYRKSWRCRQPGLPLEPEVRNSSD
jgi:hypothetical protein